MCHKSKFKENVQIRKPFYASVQILKINNLLLIEFLSTNGFVMQKHIAKEFLFLLKCGFISYSILRWNKSKLRTFVFINWWKIGIGMFLFACWWFWHTYQHTKAFRPIAPSSAVFQVFKEFDGQYCLQRWISDLEKEHTRKMHITITVELNFTIIFTFPS